jgi:Fe-S cluster biosynthesis and repair protein YggX
MALEQQSNIRRDSFGQEEITHTGNLLRELWKSVSQASFEEWIRGTLILVQQKKVLFLEMYGGSELEETEESEVCEVRKTSGKGNNTASELLQLWKIGASGNPPQGFEPSEQLTRELSAVMQEMSRQTAPSDTFMFCLWEASKEEGLLRESLQSVFESRKTRQEAAGSAGTGTKTTSRINCQPDGISGTVSSKWAKGTGGPARDEHYNLVCQEETTVDFGRTSDRIRINADKAATIQAGGGGGGAKTGLYLLPVSITEPTYAIRTAQTSSNGWGITEELSYTLDLAGGQAVAQPIAFNGRQSHISPGVFAGTLDTGHPQAQCVAYPDPANTLLAKSNLSYRGDVDTVVAVDVRNLNETKELSGTLQSKSGGGYSLNYQNPVRIGYRVRRLTPVECLRLMGFPDWWLDIEGGSDSAKYKATGNSVAIPCVEFVFSQIVKVLERTEQR